MKDSKDKTIKTIKTIEMLPLRGMWILPGLTASFEAGRDFSIKAIEKSRQKDSTIFLTTQKDPVIEKMDKNNFNIVGVLAKIKQTIKLPDGSYKVMVEGISRAKLVEYKKEDDYFEVEIEIIEENDFLDEIKFEAYKMAILHSFHNFMEQKNDLPEDMLFHLNKIESLSKLVDNIISYIRPNFDEVQKFLEEFDLLKRSLELIHYLDKESEILKYHNELSSKIREKINDNQKEYYLREQLEVIKQELDQVEGNPSSIYEEYEKRIKELKIDEESKEHLLKETKRLEYINSQSPEVNVIRTYLDNVLDIPFGKFSDDNIDINNAKKYLDRDHYGLEDVKERILEFLSVLLLKKDLKGPILCLVGPPGVGKTSIVKSVAESMNREYISMKLGGLTDENEIRGHRKTYIGAMPGRIISLLQKAKTLNPVFLLDEIDKVSSSYRADPSSALLEVLDPNQNQEFLDRYIEIPVDLSKVLFITTANTTQTIPQALLDRMEVIRLSGYTEYDKFIIAKKYLVSKQIKDNGLKQSQVSISDAVIKIIIKNYTREAGVRNLEREIAKICRKSAMKVVEGQKKINVTIKNYKDFLGREKILDDDIVRKPEIGVVTGLAWTSVGGELLQIEVNTMKGKGKISLTGSLGDVMKESAIAALSFIKANSIELNLDDINFDEIDIHVHVPEGATPKDGPSAGITMTTGIVSALSKKKVSQDIAMTGEVTIRGRVLPIGGLKEKVLAARRYGINNIIIPKQNESDLEDIPEKIREDMKFYPVSDVREVLDIALENKKEDSNEN